MRLEEDIKIWLAQASELLSEKEFAQAEQLIERVLGIQADHFDALVLFGILYVSTNRGQLATKRCNQMIKQYPDSPGPYRALSMIIRVTGHIELGIRHFTLLMESTTEKGQTYVSLCLAELNCALGRYVEAKNHLVHGSQSEEFLTMAMLYQEIGDAAGLEQLLPRIENDAIRLTLQAVAAQIKGDYDKAAQDFYNASEEDNPPWLAHNALAGMWLDSGDLESAKYYLDEALELAPNMSEVIVNRARYLKACHKNDDAYTLFQQVAEGAGNFAKVRNLAQHYMKQMALGR